MGVMLSDDRLAEIEARAAAAQPAPWPLPDEWVDAYDERAPLDHEGCPIWPWRTEENMVFAYKAREDVPDLLAEVRRLKRDNHLLSLSRGVPNVGED